MTAWHGPIQSPLKFRCADSAPTKGKPAVDDYTAFGDGGASPAARPADHGHAVFPALSPTAVALADAPAGAPEDVPPGGPLPPAHAWDGGFGMPGPDASGSVPEAFGDSCGAGPFPHPGPDSDPEPDPGPCTGAPDLDDVPGPDEWEVERPAASHRPAPRRHRRKHRARRSAVFTLAMPSMAVVGVAAAAVAGVAVGHGASRPPSAAGRQPHRPDLRTTGAGRDARDTASRASRDRQRADLQQREEDARRQAAQEAARREELRPKFALPVFHRGLSAYFGQVGINWMSFHTGVDFPVDVGTPVRAATDGTVSTEWNPAYGNMVKVTAPDGTQTWYCHLSRAKVRSGTVQAGQVIAYSGNTGNTTGPHLHFEVRPEGGEPADPLPWLLGHGLDPR